MVETCVLFPKLLLDSREVYDGRLRNVLHRLQLVDALFQSADVLGILEGCGDTVQFIQND